MLDEFANSATRSWLKRPGMMAAWMPPPENWRSDKSGVQMPHGITTKSPQFMQTAQPVWGLRNNIAAKSLHLQAQCTPPQTPNGLALILRQKQSKLLKLAEVGDMRPNG
jgi:hypothetical protein